MKRLQQFEQMAETARCEAIPDADVTDSVMQRIYDAERTGVTNDRPNEPARWGASSRFRRALQWAVAASVVCIAAWWIRPNPNLALAEVEQAIAALAESRDRMYAIEINMRSPLGRSRQKQATLYIRGRDAIVLRFPGPLASECTAGVTEGEGWLVPAVGPVLVSDDQAILDRWLSPENAPMPLLRLDAILERLSTRFDLEFHKNDAPADEIDPLWRHVTGRRRTTEGRSPNVIELWTHPESGVVERLELYWPEERFHPGPQRVTVVLESEASLGENFFEHNAHHEPDRTVKRVP